MAQTDLMHMPDLRFRFWNAETRKMESDVHPIWYGNPDGSISMLGFLDERDHQQLFDDTSYGHPSAAMPWTGLVAQDGTLIYNWDYITIGDSDLIYWVHCPTGSFMATNVKARVHLSTISSPITVVGNWFEHPHMEELL